MPAGPAGRPAFPNNCAPLQSATSFQHSQVTHNACLFLAFGHSTFAFKLEGLGITDVICASQEELQGAALLQAASGHVLVLHVQLPMLDTSKMPHRWSSS
jgi:hypothetical protein